MFRLNLLNIVTLLNLKVILGYHPIRPKKISTILKSKISKSILVETGMLLSQLSVHFQNKISLSLLIRFLVLYIIPDLKLMTRKGLMGYLPEISLTWKNPALFFSWPRQLELPEVQPPKGTTAMTSKEGNLQKSKNNLAIHMFTQSDSIAILLCNWRRWPMIATHKFYLGHK